MKTTQKFLAALFASAFLAFASLSAIAETASVEVAAVNINTATAEELATTLTGIGQAKAELIIQFREEQGPFTSMEQLLEIKGVGMATLEKNRHKIEL